MNEYIDIQMITRGLECNIIRPVLTEDGLTARIGEHWFFFGGHEFEFTDPGSLPLNVLANEIKSCLDGFHENWDCYSLEYLYYYYFLKENLASNSCYKIATFISEWDGGYATFQTDCKVNLSSGIVYDIESVDVSDFDLNSLDYEGVIIDGKEYPVSLSEDNNTYYVTL